jgi:hypothetical protein
MKFDVKKYIKVALLDGRQDHEYYGLFLGWGIKENKKGIPVTHAIVAVPDDEIRENFRVQMVKVKWVRFELNEEW